MVCIGGSIGKCNINTIDVSCNQQINIISPILHSVQMTKIVCQATYFQDLLLIKSSGSATPIINKGKWEKLPFPLPTLSEQKAIVKIVEQLFEEVEILERLTEERLVIKQNYTTAILNRLANKNTEATWQQLLPQFEQFFDTEKSIKALRQTILQLAVQGKLTKDWRKANPNTASATELLQQIKTEKERLIAEKVINKEKVLPKITKEEIPFELPENWVWCRLNDISLKIGDVDHKMPQSVSEGIPYVSPRDFTNSDVINFEKSKKISIEDFERLAKKIFPEKGDIIFPRYGTLGKNIFVKTDKKFIVSYSCAVIKHLKGFTNSEFIFCYSVSPFIREHFQQYIMKTTQPNIGIKSIKNFLVPLPPLSEQKAIVEKVATLLGCCDALEAAIAERGKRVEALMDGSLSGILGV
jgi:type I restriction enzyme S subunit